MRCPNSHIASSKSFPSLLIRVHRPLTNAKPVPLPFLHPRSLVSASTDRRRYCGSGEANPRTFRGSRHELYRGTNLGGPQHRAASSAADNETGLCDSGTSTDPQDERKEATHGRARKQARYSPHSEKARDDLKQMVEALQNMTKDPDRRVIRRESDAVDYNLPESPVVRRKRVQKLQRKPRPSEAQQALMSDPWAQILASPVRHCTGSGARLPIALLTNWGFMRHPDDKSKVYIMPNGLVDGIKDLETMGQGLLERKAEQIGLSRAQDDGENVEQPRAVDKTSENLLGLRQITSTTKKGNAPGIRILPYYNLLRQLNIEFSKQADPTDPSIRESRPGQAAPLVPTPWKIRLDEVRHYEGHRRELAAQTGLADLRPPDDEATIDIRRLNWRPDAPSKVLDVMRQRVTAALKRVLEMNSSGLSTKRRDIVALPSAILNYRDHLRGTDNTDTDDSDRIGSPTNDIEADLEEHNPQKTQNDAAPDEDTSQRTPTEYRNIRKPRTFLYFGPHPSSTISDLLSHSPTTPIPSTLSTTTTSVAELMPPRISTFPPDSHTPSSPIFPLRPLLGEALYTTLLQHVQAQAYLFQHPAFSHASAPVVAEDLDEFVLCLKTSAHFADVLVREIWQLWRYVGGRRALDVGTDEGGVEGMVGQSPW